MSATTLQYCLVQHEPVATMDAFDLEIDALVDEYPHVDLFVFPEMHLCDGRADGPLDSLTEFVEPIDGPRDQRLKAAARRHGIWLIPGSVWEQETHPRASELPASATPRAFNTALVYSPEGERIASYRKIFPWQPYEQATPGSEFVVFELGAFGRVGLSICYDIWFPEHARQLAWFGADLIVNIVRTSTSDREQEVVLCRATAIANQVGVLSVNAASPGARGRTVAADAEGRVRGEAIDSSAQELIDTIDLADSQRVRRTGTSGINRMWVQLEDLSVNLPMYAGGMIQKSQALRSDKTF